VNGREWVAVVSISLIVGAVAGLVGLVALDGLFTLLLWIADAGEAVGFR